MPNVNAGLAERYGVGLYRKPGVPAKMMPSMQMCRWFMCGVRR